MLLRFLTLASLSVLLTAGAHALEYPYTTAEPQKIGWPLTPEERAYVLKPEHERRPGREVNKHLPEFWPAVPSAGHWGGTSGLDTHAKLVGYVQANRGPIDIPLVGDGLTQQWGSPLDKGVLNQAWKKHFANYKTINIGIGGDKAQNVLWRLDHGGVEGLQPKVVIVMIGNNNMFFTPETGIEAAAKGVQMCVANVSDKFPLAEVIAVKILPAHAPGNRFYEDIKRTNLALDALKFDSDPKVKVIDLWNDMVNADGTLKQGLFTPDNIHLSQTGGYELYASKLKPLVESLLTKRSAPQPLSWPARPLLRPPRIGPRHGVQPYPRLPSLCRRPEGPGVSVSLLATLSLPLRQACRRSSGRIISLFVQTEAVGVLNQLSGRHFTHSRHVVWDASGITLQQDEGRHGVSPSGAFRRVPSG